jgi:hypothetical protein
MTITEASALIEIEAEIVAIASSMASSRARLLLLVGEFDAANAWVATGEPSCAHWLASLLDVELCTAREQVRTAKALRELPETSRRLQAGALSYAKVRQLTRVATAANEQELLAIADRHPAGQLAHALGAWQRRNDPETADRRAHEERGVSVRNEPTGNWTMVVQLQAATIAVLEAMIDAERMYAPAGATSRGATLRHQRADALERLVRVWATGDAPAGASATLGRLRPELVLHRRIGETSLTDGTVLPIAVARQFSCDVDLRVMTHLPDGSPADVGRRYRLVPPRLRRLVRERDGDRCRYPGCRTRHYVEVHHIVHWEDGGETILINLISLCGYHHAFVHEHGWPPGCYPSDMTRLVA